MELGLTNNLDLPLNLADAKISSTLCERCWFLPMSAKPNLTLLNPHKSTSLMISIRPNTFTALGKSIISLNPNTAHDTVLISVASVAEQGGLVTMQEFKLPVRFAPPVLYLFSTVLAAALLGALLHRWLGLATPHKWREAGIAFVIGIVIWLAALVLFSLETRVTIFGFTLDPTQLIPAGLIAFLAAGGPPVVSKVKAAFGR